MTSMAVDCFEIGGFLENVSPLYCMLKTEHTQQCTLFTGHNVLTQIPLKISISHGNEKALHQVSQLPRHHFGVKVSDAIIPLLIQRQLGKSESVLHDLSGNS